MIRSSANMMMDSCFSVEALSAALGVTVKFQSDCKDLSDEVHHLDITNLTALALLDFNTFAFKPASHFTSVEKTAYHLPTTLQFVGDQKKSATQETPKRESASTSLQKKIFSIPDDFFDPAFDFDFTNMSELKSDSKCMRGDEPYKRPYGWMRFALKVRDKFPDGNDWLGTIGWRDSSSPGEWPVSYHGTSKQGAEGIIKSHFKAGDGAVYGRGIYSSPDIREADEYATARMFTSQWNGKTYKVIMQNRINPKQREIIEDANYWLVPIPKATPPEKEKEIVERSIRPYGLLVKEVKTSDLFSMNG